MARGDSLFCRVELDFILMDDRWVDMTPTAAKVYITLWAIAVHERRECLPPRYTPRTVARRSGIDPRTGPAAIANLQDICLVSMSDDNCIIVHGAGSKHRKLKGWLDETGSPYGEDTGPISGESKRESKSKRESNTPKPPAGGTDMFGGSKSAYSEEFEIFWKAYPSRPNNPKQGAFTKWKKLVSNGTLESDLIKAAVNYALYRKGGDPTMTKMAATFLGPSAAWEEWVDPPADHLKGQDKRLPSAQGKYLTPEPGKYDGVAKRYDQGGSSKDEGV